MQALNIQDVLLGTVTVETMLEEIGMEIQFQVGFKTAITNVQDVIYQSIKSVGSGPTNSFLPTRIFHQTNTPPFVELVTGATLKMILEDLGSGNLKPLTQK